MYFGFKLNKPIFTSLNQCCSVSTQVNGHNLVDGQHHEAVEALKKSGNQVFVKLSREMMLTVGIPAVR